MQKFVTIRLGENSSLKNFLHPIQNALSLLNLVIRNPHFAEVIHQTKFDWRNLPFQLNDEEVFSFLFQSNVFHDMNIIIQKHHGKFGKLNKNILGTTIVGTQKTIINELWIQSLPQNDFSTIIELAAHLAHEYCHQKGFYDGKKIGQIDVVPYFIGDLTYDIASELYRGANIYIN